MTPQEILRKNLIKMGFTCNKCGRVYSDDHPMDPANSYWLKSTADITDTCNNEPMSRTYYTFRSRRTIRNYNLFKLQGQWYRVRAPLVEMFLSMAEIEEGVMGSIHYPEPIEIARQVDIFTAAEKLKLPPPLNAYQQKRAKSKAFIERIKK